MKIIKTIIPLILFFVSSFAFGQIVNIPDTFLKAKLLEADVTNFIAKDLSGNYFKIDANNDGEIQETEALQVSYFIMTDVFDFTDPTGLSYFLNLTYLNLYSCQQLNQIDVSPLLNLEYLNLNKTSLSVLDVSNNINLTYLNCGHNQLVGIDISNNINLVEFICETNNITSIDVSNNVNLTKLDCNLNSLTNIDLSNNINLNNLILSSNNLIALDVSNLVNLTNLSGYSNSIPYLDVSNCVNLDVLQCNQNNLTSIDISNNRVLSYIGCGGDSFLNSINMKNGLNNDSFFIGNSPNLQFVCVDNEEESFVTDYLISNGMTVNVSSYCSFVPGGDYNTINGVVTYDDNNNGCDVNDILNPFNKIIISDGIETGVTFTTNSGEYNFYTQDGTFAITPDLENPTFFNVTPIDTTINFPDNNNNIAIQDFCITANGVHNDVEIVMGPTIRARPGFDAGYIITYKNKGNQTLSGDFVFNYDDAVLDFLTATEVPIAQISGQLTWDYINLLPFESRSVYVTLNVNGPTETPAINIGDQLDFSVAINPIAGDELPNDNTFGYKQTVVGSYDPNDIICLEGDVLEPAQIGEYLHYIINFENTGNFAAQNIVVATEIDPTMFDVSTLRVLSSSHDAYVKQTGDLVEIVFESIYLSSGGHGNILLKVQSQDILVEDDTVTKSANIFFDYNFPIQTNDANTTYQQLLSTTTYGIDQNVTIYPNPVKNWVTISSKENIKSVSVFDVQGRVLQTQITNNKEVKIDISNRSDGVYFVKIQTEKGIKVEKIIKQ